MLYHSEYNERNRLENRVCVLSKPSPEVPKRQAWILTNSEMLIILSLY